MGAILNLRQRLLKAEGFAFDAIIEADYGDDMYSFSMDCRVDAEGNLKFEVKAPEAIRGISGRFDTSGGKMIFDEQVLAFPVLADGEITPVSAPWVLSRTLLGGYIHSVGKEQNGYHAIINESYEEKALQLDVWFDSSKKPIRAEILWEGRRILTITIENFEIL